MHDQGLAVYFKKWFGTMLRIRMEAAAAAGSDNQGMMYIGKCSGFNSH
jgi:hypothetical protein